MRMGSQLREEGQISAWQAMNLIIAIILPTAILFVPTLVSIDARQDAWLSVVIAFVLGSGVAILAGGLAQRFPGETVIQFAPRLVGRIPGKIVGLVFIFYLFYVTFVVQREFGELMAGAFYARTPQLVFVVTLTLLAVYLAYKGLEVLARVNDFVMFIFLAAFVLFVALVAWNVRLEEFLPFLEFGLGPVLLGSLYPAAWFGEVLVIMLLVPFVSQKRRAVKAAVSGLLITFVALQVVMLGTTAVLGAEEAARIPFASFFVVRRTEILQVEFFQRQDALFMMIWVGAMLMKLAAWFYLGVLALSQWLNLRTWRPTVFPLAVLLTVLSINSWPNFAVFAAHTRESLPFVIGSVSYLIVPLLFLAALVRGRAAKTPRR